VIFAAIHPKSKHSAVMKKACQTLFLARHGNLKKDRMDAGIYHALWIVRMDKKRVTKKSGWPPVKRKIPKCLLKESPYPIPQNVRVGRAT